METMKKAKLNNGIEMPYVGLGVFRMDDNKETEKTIETALSIGYRHIDTAAYYLNEDAVGRAIRKSSIKRNEIFITTKLWNDDQRSGKIERAFEDSLRKLGTDYIDLYLIHWPVAGKFVETWQKMERIYENGRIKAIGVSNFKEHHLEALKKASSIIPAVNQIELHPYLIQEPILDYCKKEGIQTEAWSPFAANKTNLFEENILREIAAKHSKTPAQIILRWDIQREVIVIPKSSNRNRLEENINIFDFELSEEDVRRINSLDKKERIGADPDNFNF